MVDRHDSASSRPHARARKKMDDIGLIREKEFFLYYPQRPKSNGPLSRQPSPPAYEHSLSPPATPLPLPTTHDLRESKDHALSAFAQLGALRLNTRRCLISFFDRRNCYILAEATKSLCLHTGLPDLAEDSLCWGNAIFPKEMSLCYYTVNLPWKHADMFRDAVENHPALVVNDLAKDARFCEYPFVAGPPFSRFYAGVPIRSPSGHSIGTYCVLDDKPRDGLTPAELAFLKDMAGTVMRHLEMTRATEDQRRGKFMVKSLGSFAEGKSGLENWWAEPWDTSPEGPPNDTSMRRRSSQISAKAAQEALQLNRSGSEESSAPSVSSQNLTSTPSLQSGSATMTPGTETVPEIRLPVTTTLTSNPSKNDPKGLIPPEIKAAFGRAANMIVDATEAEGAAFFDAKISTFGGLVDDDFFSEQLPEPDKPCNLLGAAVCKSIRESKAITEAECSMSESVLRHLLRAYPHGHIFNLDEDIICSNFNSPSGGGIELETRDGFPFSLSRKSESVRSSDDENYLRTVFPKARSLVLYPLWDSHRNRWFASAFIWSSNPMRVFTNEQELSYLAAFSNSVMAEVARLDMKSADAAKADFISSISHELRSPLHGILGMTDLLKDSVTDNQQSSHVATIETCGKTLLETINHVLDFAKINNLTRGSSRRQKKRTHSSKHMISPGQAHTNDIMTLISDVDMRVLTEDVVESVFAGYTYQKTSTDGYETTSQKGSAPSISVILDISRSSNYVFRTQPGAWRRVIMNLFGNSLKYTPAGYIKVKLEVKPKRDVTDEFCEFKLTVTDSGIGMSEDYVNNRLFHSFAQENPLSQGTGLGLSIVKQIVESLGGDVEIRSEKGRGTKFTVSCPLKLSALSPTSCAIGSDREKEKHLLQVAQRTKGMKIRFSGFDAEEDYFVEDLKNKTATKLSLKAINSLCTEWFGMVRTDVEGEADIIVATESRATLMRSQHSQNPAKSAPAPVIVICHGAASAKSTTAITVPGIIFECIGQPVGPHKMADAIASCLERRANRIRSLSTTSESGLRDVVPLNLKESVPLVMLSPGTPAMENQRPTLPSLNSAPEIRPRQATALKKSIYSKPSRSLNCLAVDDNPINLRLLRTFVDKLGHQHILAVNGLEALELYKSAQTPHATASPILPLTNDNQQIDVILMDINMPEMDGLEATRQIRAHEIRHNLPKVTIIALTGVADSEIQHEANSSGVNLFMIKPVRLAELEVVLKGVITGQDNAKQDLLREREKLVGQIGCDELERLSSTDTISRLDAGTYSP